MALEQLLAALERDALSQAGARLDRARREAADLLSDGRARIARETSAKLGALEAELRDGRQARLLDVRRAALRRVLEARQRMFDRVLREALRRLPEAQRGETFRALLPMVIAEALTCAGDGPLLVSCPAALRDAVQRALGDRPGVTLRIDPGIGAGVRVESADGACVIDGSLETRLERLVPLLKIGILGDLEEEP